MGYFIFIILRSEVGYSGGKYPPPPPHLLIKRGTSFLEPFRKVKWVIKFFHVFVDFNRIFQGFFPCFPSNKAYKAIKYYVKI